MRNYRLPDIWCGRATFSDPSMNTKSILMTITWSDFLNPPGLEYTSGSTSARLSGPRTYAPRMLIVHLESPPPPTTAISSPMGTRRGASFLAESDTCTHSSLGKYAICIKADMRNLRSSKLTPPISIWFAYVEGVVKFVVSAVIFLTFASPPLIDVPEISERVITSEPFTCRESVEEYAPHFGFFPVA